MPKDERWNELTRSAATAISTGEPHMKKPTPKAKKSEVKLKDLKPKKNVKGGLRDDSFQVRPR